MKTSLDKPEASLRERLVCIALEWQQRYGVAPSITSAVSELDAVRLAGWPEREYCAQMEHRTAVGKGYNFIHDGARYQVKANCPSGKPGSFVTKVGKAKNYEWDHLIWILYNRRYEMMEA